MGWRYVCIDEASRINYRLNNIGIVYKDETIWINLDEIDTVIITDSRCNTSIKLLQELVEKGISVIICSNNHMPVGLFLPFQNHSRSSKYNKCQLEWSIAIKKTVWKEIVKNKIALQSAVLQKWGRTNKLPLLTQYLMEVEDGDPTNREGLAAKVYFRELFGEGFSRERRDEGIINLSLNYIYQIVRSKIAQVIVGHGYIPSLGIFHISEYNYFGFADDLIEVFRPICDHYVMKLLQKEDVKFMSPIFKEKLVGILLEKVEIRGTKQKISEAIKIFVRSVTDALTSQKLDTLQFPLFVYEK